MEREDYSANLELLPDTPLPTETGVPPLWSEVAWTDPPCSPEERVRIKADHDEISFRWPHTGHEVTLTYDDLCFLKALISARRPRR